MKVQFDFSKLDRLLQQAETAHKARRLSEAEAGYSQILAFEKSLPSTAALNREAEQLRGALTFIFGQTYNNLGRIRSAQGRSAEAMDCYRSALDYIPGNPAVLTNASQASRALGNRDKAIEYSKQALQIDPHFLPAVVQFALVALDEGRAQDALRHLQDTEHLASTLPSFLMAHGQVLEAGGQLAHAKEKYLAAEKLPDAKIPARLLAGSVCQRLGQFEEARRHYQGVLALDPRHLRANTALGMLNLHLGRYAAAEKAMRKALSIDPANLDVISNYALLLYQLSRFPEALKIASEVAVAPTTTDDQRRTGALVEAGSLRRLGKPAEALAALQRLEESLPSVGRECSFLKERGLSLEALELFEEAFESFARGNTHFQQEVNRNFPVERDAAVNFAELLAGDFSGLDALAPVSEETPVFIVGFQQGGHQVLAALLEGSSEFNVVSNAALFYALRKQLAPHQTPLPSVLHDVEGPVLADLVAQHRDALENMDIPSGRLTIHANPANLYELPLIVRMFPKARVIYVAAHPLDVCVHCFTKDFVPGRATRSYSNLEDTAHQLIHAQRLWQKFKTEMRFSHLEVSSQELFDNTEVAVDRVLKFIGEGSAYPLLTRASTIDRLHEIALEHKTLTPPERWKRYRHHLSPIIPVLDETCRLGGHTIP